MGRSVVDLAGEVDAALGRLASAEHQRAVAEESLEQAKNLEAQCRREVDEARDALFEEHPSLAPKGWTHTETKRDIVAERRQTEDRIDAGPWDPEPVEVDDENDPRFASGAGAALPTDGPLPPLDFEERE